MILFRSSFLLYYLCTVIGTYPNRT